MVIQEPATEPDGDPGSSGRRRRSRSRERAPEHVSPSADEESAAVEPQCRVSDLTVQGRHKERKVHKDRRESVRGVVDQRARLLIRGSAQGVSLRTDPHKR